MKKRICFFSVGFAFNRLQRLIFYEKIFPSNVEIFLYTTDRYAGKEKENYQYQWVGLKRTKVVIGDYNPLKLFFGFRKFCIENKIERIFNLGFHTSWPILFFSTFLSKRDYCLNVLTDIFNQHWFVETWSKKFKEIFTLLFLFPGVFFAKKVFFTDRVDFRRAPLFFFSRRSKMNWLAAPVNTDLFRKKNKAIKKRLDLANHKKIVIFVGRIEYLKCSDILRRLIAENQDTFFLIVGRVIDDSFLDIPGENFRLIPKLSSEQLIAYYNSSDLSFCLNRGGGGIGLATEEALSCGVPVIVSKHFGLKESEALLQSKIDFAEANEVLRRFFSLSSKKREKLSKIARKYVRENYSYRVWGKEYSKSYLDS